MYPRGTAKFTIILSLHGPKGDVPRKIGKASPDFFEKKIAGEK